MPSFDTTVDFEVFCGECGAGLCLQSYTRSSRTRNVPQVVVDPCKICLERATDAAAEEARKNLEAELARRERT